MGVNLYVSNSTADVEERCFFASSTVGRWVDIISDWCEKFGYSCVIQQNDVDGLHGFDVERKAVEHYLDYIQDVGASPVEWRPSAGNGKIYLMPGHKTYQETAEHINRWLVCTIKEMLRVADRSDMFVRSYIA